MYLNIRVIFILRLNVLCLKMHKNLRFVLPLLIFSYMVCTSNAFLEDDQTIFSVSHEVNKEINNTSHNRSSLIGSVGSPVSSNGYLDSLDNLERSVAAVLIKVAYGTTSTTKRSIPDHIHIASLTTVATPLLTTLRYQEKHQHQHINLHHRNYEFDLERDHALPTSAPNADILKSNSNPTYPNPNRQLGHDRDRHRYPYSSTSMPSFSSLHKKSNNQSPTVAMNTGDIPSYSPPSRAFFFTPPLPPEYQNPFADKPTLRGTNNEGVITNSGMYVNRRPIPPPSLMPGHERIPYRPPDLAASTGNGNNTGNNNSLNSTGKQTPTTVSTTIEVERKHTLNTPSRSIDENSNKLNHFSGTSNQHEVVLNNEGDASIKHQEVLPSIRRILSGSNGKKGDVPEVLLKHVTTRPLVNFHVPSTSPIDLIDSTAKKDGKSAENAVNVIASSPNINKIKPTVYRLENNANNFQIKNNTSVKPPSLENTNIDINDKYQKTIVSTPSAAGAIEEHSTTSVLTSSINSKNFMTTSVPPLRSITSSGETEATSKTGNSSWSIAWNVHVYLSVILFTILAVFSFYKMLTYNKLTHLFSQSYFLCIHFILIIICSTRIFYLCYDAYNIHASFHIFAAELLLNLPATFLTVSFSVLILFLFLKSFNHKSNRYSALIRPLTVIIGCGVHVLLCITLHYVESYTLQNQHIYYQQHHQQQYYRRQYAMQQQQQLTLLSVSASNMQVLSPSTSMASPAPPPRVLALICQIIYIFICLSLGILYLYLYRILKRILRSKSQNYIHGYQNLSYAIHITIATALLFVLLAALQIFGIISISTSRSLTTQSISEVDWLQWGYQFSLRLVEIAIITLISWVTGLKTSSNVNVGVIFNTDERIESSVGASGGLNAIQGNTLSNNEKQSGGHHTNVANFFLPCTTTSSQEQFDTDYPAICNANTNLHTYTMRTGKLIYDDTHVLKSIGVPNCGGSSAGRNFAEYQLTQATYRRPYDTTTTSSTINDFPDYGKHDISHKYNRFRHQSAEQHHYADYIIGVTTDHYENPNFDLHGYAPASCSSRPGAHASALQKNNNISTNSTTGLNNGDSNSSVSQQQMLLLQSDGCYSEPMQTNTSFEFHNFERPLYGGEDVLNNKKSSEYWPEKRTSNICRDKTCLTKFERSGSDNPERLSANSTTSCTSGGGGVAQNRFTNYNTFDLSNHSSVRKSGTLNNISSNNIKLNRANSRENATAKPIGKQKSSGSQPLVMLERKPSHQRTGLNHIHASNNTSSFGKNQTLHQQSHHLYNQNSDEDEDEDIISVSNIECTNLINNEDGSCITNSSNSATSAVGGNITDQGICSNSTNSESLQQTNKGKLPLLHQQHERNSTNHSHAIYVESNIVPIHHQYNLSNTHSSGHDTASPSSTSSNSGTTVSESMLVTEHGFLRFRALDDINNVQGVGIHNGSIRNQSRTVATIKSNSNHVDPSSDTAIGINC